MDTARNQGDPIDRLVVIPARIGSGRLPRKPLIVVEGVPIIIRTLENARMSRLADDIVVATDSEEIAAVVSAASGRVVMTSCHHPSGSDRVAEVACSLRPRYIVNVQGDEPRIPPQIIDDLFLALQGGAAVATAARPLRSPSELTDPSRVKVLCDKQGRALLFSRAGIPFCREASDSAAALALARVHIGIYAYTLDALLSYTQLDRPVLEDVERLEQLRLLWHGIPISVLDCPDFGDSIDTPEDLERFQLTLQNERQL